MPITLRGKDGDVERKQIGISGNGIPVSFRRAMCHRPFGIEIFNFPGRTVVLRQRRPGGPGLGLAGRVVSPLGQGEAVLLAGEGGDCRVEPLD